MPESNHTHFNFTRARLRDLQPEPREYYVSDRGQPGLKCRVLPSGGKTLGVRKQQKGSRRTTPFIPICRVDCKRSTKSVLAQMILI